ncbi:MAG: ASKHA domain-containing protein, partial [Candidatus Hodarchaeota archaeon]
MPKKHVVRFQPDGKETSVEEGESVYDAAHAADVYIESVCGGIGECGKCKVKVEKGKVSGGTSTLLTEDDERRGLILACLASIESDLEIFVPEESRASMHQILTRSEALSLHAIDSPVKKYRVLLKKPDLSDNIGDYTRLGRSLKDAGCQDAGISLDLLRTLGTWLRECNWDVTATVAESNCGHEVIALDCGDTANRCYGIAVDVGTTTIVVELVDLVKGGVIDSEASQNKQVACGEDVLARILYTEEKGGLEKLRSLAVTTINNLIGELAKRNKLNQSDIYGVAVAGNTVMTHLLYGLNPKSIRASPYIPWVNYLPQYRAKELGINTNPDAVVYASPCRSSYVGGDITADILASSLHKSKLLSMLIDVGTNGEVVLGNKDWMVAASCSAGPAFEGGEVACGMRAATGAIERISLNDKLEVSFSTIGNTKPRGVCGSGLIDLLAELFAHNILDKSGKFHANSYPRIREGRDGKEFVVAWADETSVNQDIAINQVDIGNIIRTKAAAYAAGRVLLNKTGYTFNDVKQLFI